jgi:hypothetical protein
MRVVQTGTSGDHHGALAAVEKLRERLRGNITRTDIAREHHEFIRPIAGARPTNGKSDRERL